MMDPAPQVPRTVVHIACRTSCAPPEARLLFAVPAAASDEHMRLSDFLRSDFVVPRLQGRDVTSVVHEVSRLAASLGLGTEEHISEKLLERERAHPTVMGEGLAIPHATVPGLTEPVIGVALAGEPIEFGGPDFDPVRVFVVLLSPPGGEREHVKILARICRLMRHRNFIDSLEAAPDQAGIVHVIETIDAHHA